MSGAQVHPVYHGGKRHPEQTTDEYLTCFLCQVPGFKHPKTLQCGHIFCLGCLAQYSGEKAEVIVCPTCKQATCCPPGGITKLSDNLFVSSQVDRLVRRHNNYGSARRVQGDSFYHIMEY